MLSRALQVSCCVHVFPLLKVIVLLMRDGGAAPLLFKRMGRDPATLAGPMETSIQDVLGYGTFMLLGHLLLPLIDK